MVLKNFEKLIDYEDIKKIMFEANPYEAGMFMSTFLKSICVIKNEQLYVKQQNDTYNVAKNVENELLVLVSKLFIESERSLTQQQKDKLRYENSKQYHALQSNTHTKGYIPQLRAFLQNDDIVFDYTPAELHFNNGYIDILKNKFINKRTNNHFITKYIKRDYSPSTEEERKSYVENVINKIYPDKNDRDLILTLISTGLSWKAPTLQQSLFLVGVGSSGKSTILKHLQDTLTECYFAELKHDAFSNESKMDKVLNTFHGNPYLYSWINEMDAKRCDTSVYKSFCDGVINTTKLYTDGSHNLRHFALAIATSNELPNMQQDTGTKRRIIGYEHKSKFVDDSQAVNIKDNVFLKDKHMDEKIPYYFNAIIDIYTKYCSNWLNGKFTLDFSKSKNFNDTKDLITSTNDYFQDFIDKCLIRTDNENDRIGKEQMRELFISNYNDKRVNVLQVITSLKDKNIKYDKEKRCDGVKGCFVCVKTKQDINADPLEDNVEKIELSVSQPMANEDILNKIKQYEEQIKLLQEQLLKNCNESFPTEQKVQVEIKQVIEVKVVNETTPQEKYYFDDQPDFEIDFS
jgi:hypothetical protein